MWLPVPGERPESAKLLVRTSRIVGDNRQMKRTVTALFTLGVLSLSSVFMTGFRSPGRPLAATHPLIGESLTALTGLVAKENCAVHDAADDDIENGAELPFVLCDDGLPPSGGGEGGIPSPPSTRSMRTRTTGVASLSRHRTTRRPKPTRPTTCNQRTGTGSRWTST